jgi:hypothetical protein
MNDRVLLQRKREGTHHRADILVKTARNLVAGKTRGRAKARHLHGLDKFTRRAVLFPVSKEEGFERQLASCGVATQPQCCAERDPRRRQIPIGEPLAMLPPTVPALQI